MEEITASLGNANDTPESGFLHHDKSKIWQGRLFSWWTKLFHFSLCFFDKGIIINLQVQELDFEVVMHS